VVGQGCEVGLARQGSAQAPDSVLDAALLPGGMGIAEIGLAAELVQPVMACELGTIVEGEGAAQPFGHGLHEAGDLFGDEVGGLVGGPGGEEDAGSSVVQGEDGLAVPGEHDEISFPMPADGPAQGLGRALIDADALFHEAGGASASAAAQAAL